jgi:signal transduction histidine kinase
MPRLSAFIMRLIAFALICLVGLADVASGEEISFSIFYLLPIGYAAWFIDRKSGIAAAVASAVVWLTAERTNHVPYSHAIIPFWNATVRLVFFLILVGFIDVLKRTEIRLVREVFRRTRTLRLESENRRRLEREMAEVTAAELARLAEDLHDGLGQYLSALAFHVGMLAEDLRLNNSVHADRAERVVELVRITNQITRRLDRTLRVPAAAEGGIWTALRVLVGEFEKLTGIHCQATLPEAPLALDEFRSMTIYRVVQEALNNAVKHASAQEINVVATIADNTLRVTVSDNGIGFFPGDANSPGTGLRIMKHRAELVGARLDFGAGANGGCRLECAMPLITPVSAVGNGKTDEH